MTHDAAASAAMTEKTWSVSAKFGPMSIIASPPHDPQQQRPQRHEQQRHIQRSS